MDQSSLQEVRHHIIEAKRSLNWCRGSLTASGGFTLKELQTFLDIEEELWSAYNCLGVIERRHRASEAKARRREREALP